MTTTYRWVRGSFRTAAHLTTGGRKTACGTGLGYGSVETAPDYARRCARCVRHWTQQTANPERTATP